VNANVKVKTEKIVAHGMQWLYIDIDECENPAQSLENILALFRKDERRGYTLESGSLSMGGHTVMLKLRGNVDEAGIVSLVEAAVGAETDGTEAQNDYYLSQNTIERLRRLSTMGENKIPVRDWEDVDDLIGYSACEDEVAIVNLPSRVIGRLVLIPQTFLDKFDPCDGVMVANEVLSPRWGAKKYWIEPGRRGSGRCWHGAPSNENYPDVYTGSLLIHRVRATRIPTSRIREQVEFAKEFYSSKSTFMRIEVEGVSVDV